jgi:MFS family permease
MTVDPARAHIARPVQPVADTTAAPHPTADPATPSAPPLADAEARVPAWKKPFLALEERDFRNLWVGMLPGTMAMQMGMVTTGYVAYDISRSAAAVGYVSLGMGIPMLTLGLFGGVVADRFPKKAVLMATQTVIGVSAVINAILVLTGVIQIWHLMLVSALQGSSFAFNMPSRQAFVAQLVRRERLMAAVALNNAGMNFSRVIGPSIAGALIAVPFIGAGGVYLIMAAMYVFVVLSLLRIPQRGEPVSMKQRPSPLRSLGDGLGYVRGNGVVFTLLLLAFAPVLLGMPYQALMPVFARDVFHVGPTGLGILLTVNGIGALIGSLLIAGITTFQRRGLLQMIMGILFGISVAIFAFGQSFSIALGALLVVGLVSAGFQSLNSTLVMNNTDPAYHGRVMSVYMLTFSAMPLGVVPFGWLADHYGAPITIGIGGLVLAVIITLVGALHPSYRHIK